jgi:hypothetical protein
VVPTEVTLGMHVAKLLPDYEHLGQPATCIWPIVPLCLPEPLKLAARGARTGHAPDPSRELHTAADPVLDAAALAQAIRKQSNRYIKCHPGPSVVTLCYWEDWPGRGPDHGPQSGARCAPGAFWDAGAAICAGSAPSSFPVTADPGPFPRTRWRGPPFGAPRAGKPTGHGRTRAWEVYR